MPTADSHEFNLNTRAIRWFPVLQRATTEAFAGNGIQSPGDLQVTPTTTDLEIEVVAGTAVYNGGTSSLGSATTRTLSAGGTDPRYDTVAFDTGTGSVTVREGTAEPNPVPPDLSGDEILLAVVFVAANATDVADGDIYNWRSEVIAAARATGYPFANADLDNSSVTVAGNSVALGGGTGVAYSDLSDTTSYPIPNSDLANSTVTVAGNAVGLGSATGVAYGDLSDTSSYPIPNGDLANSAVTVGTDALLTGGGDAALGGAGVTLTLDTDRVFEGDQGGKVPDGDQGIVEVTGLPGGETARVDTATLVTGTIEAVPTGVDLALVTFDNAGGFTSRAVLAAGDGTTVHDRVSGSPLGSYTNSTGSAQSVGVVVDNQSGSSVEVYASFEGARTQ